MLISMPSDWVRYVLNFFTSEGRAELKSDTHWHIWHGTWASLIEGRIDAPSRCGEGHLLGKGGRQSSVLPNDQRGRRRYASESELPSSATSDHEPTALLWALHCTTSTRLLSPPRRSQSQPSASLHSVPFDLARYGAVGSALRYSDAGYPITVRPTPLNTYASRLGTTR